MKAINLLPRPSTLFIYGFLLALLSIADTVCTDVGVRNGLIEEANPLMDFIYRKSVYLFYLLKIGLPVLLLFLINHIKPKLYFRLLLTSALLLYSIILCIHIYWIFLIHKEYSMSILA